MTGFNELNQQDEYNNASTDDIFTEGVDEDSDEDELDDSVISEDSFKDEIDDMESD